MRPPRAPGPTSSLRRRVVLACGAASALATQRAAWAQAPARAVATTKFPSQPVTLLVPFGPGGVADITARAVAEGMARVLGQLVVVDNRPSAGSIVASQAVAAARPDGHTLLLLSNGNAVSAGLFKKLPYDVLTAFAPVSTLGSFDLALFVAAASRFKTLRDVLAFAKANPGKLNIGCITVGSTQHLAAKLFETVAGIDVLVVPYKGSPAVLTALRAGEVDLAVEIAAPWVPQVTAGALRALAVSSDQRSPALPTVPTVHEAGVAGYNVASWNALAAPAGTPAAVIDTLNRAVRTVLDAPELQRKLATLGVRTQASTPAALQALLAAEARRWGDVIRSAKILPE